MTRLEPLDGLRAVAVLIVMLSHIGLMVPGGFGVTIFFFLSGYLITTLMVRERAETGDLNLKAFYLRRTVRIVPPMLIAIAVAVGLSGAGFGKDLNYSGLALDILFLSNYSPYFGAGSQIAIPLWSLAIEEHFYLIFPMLFLAIRKVGSSVHVARVCLFLCLIVLLVRIAHVALSGPIEGIYYWSHTRIDSILFGCILATWNNPASDGKVYIGSGIRWGMLGGFLVLITLIVRDPAFRETFRYTVQGMGLFLIFNYVLRTSGILSKMLADKRLRYIANISYFLYLIHISMYLAASYLPIPPILQYIVGNLCAFLLAAIVRQFIEQPLLGWRKSYEARLAMTIARKDDNGGQAPLRDF
jgi:peptidoglycan/LPS O-acetylase OafA/YrhL